MKVGAVLLGAGFSRRFGADKRIQPFGNTTVAVATARLYATCFDHVRVVIRPEDETLHQQLESLVDEFVYSKDAALGMGHSLATGFTELDLDYAFLGFLDMPFVKDQTLCELIAVAEQHDFAKIVRPVPESAHTASAEIPTYGHPLGMPRQLFGELAKCSGDVGARHIIKSQAGLIVDHVTSDAGIWRDIDRPQDLP